MSLNTRLNKNVTVSKFLELIKGADDGGMLKPVEYVQLEKLMSDNLPKNNFLNKLVNKLNTDSTSFKIDELERYNTIENPDQTLDDVEDSDAKVEQLQQHLNLIKKQKETLEYELIKLYNYELDDELSKEREQLNELKCKLTRLFEAFQPLLGKRHELKKSTKLDEQLCGQLDKLKQKKLKVDELIEEVIMHVDLNLSQDKLVKIVEREYCLKLIQIKNLLESLKIESESVLKIHRNKMIKNTIWKVYLKDFKDEMSNEENLISCANQTITPINTEGSANDNNAFNFEEFKEFLSLSKNDPIDELLIQVKNALNKFSS